MQLRRVEIIKYRNFENVVIDFEKSNFPNVFSIASKNGGGKSTLLQFIFILLHCFSDEKRRSYIENILKECLSVIEVDDIEKKEFSKFFIKDKGEEYYFIFSADRSSPFSVNFSFDTNMTVEQQIILSNNVYLTVPDAQPLHFVSEKYDKAQMRKDLPNFSILLMMQ